MCTCRSLLQLRSSASRSGEDEEQCFGASFWSISVEPCSGASHWSITLEHHIAASVWSTTQNHSSRALLLNSRAMLLSSIGEDASSRWKTLWRHERKFMKIRKRITIYEHYETAMEQGARSGLRWGIIYGERNLIRRLFRETVQGDHAAGHAGYLQGECPIP